MELQSSVDRFMALRLWVYLALFYEFLRKQKKLTPSGKPLIVIKFGTWLSCGVKVMIIRVGDSNEPPCESLRPLRTRAGSSGVSSGTCSRASATAQSQR